MSKLSKATKNDFPIIVYAKFCISCDYPDEWDKFLDWAQRNGETFKVRFMIVKITHLSLLLMTL